MFLISKKKAGIVCSGGGALGVSFLGGIERLLEKKFEFDFYAGVSAGAIIVSLLAIGKHPNQIWNLLQKTRLFSLSFDFSKVDFGLLDGKKIMIVLEKIFGDTCIEDLEVPLYIGATDFSTGEFVLISQGRIVDALRASISVPVFFIPFFHPEYKRWFVDGGLSEDLPLSAVRFYKGKNVFAFDASGLLPENDFSSQTKFGKIKNLRAVINRSLRIFSLSQHSREMLDSRVILFRLAVPYDPINVFRLKDIYEWGKGESLKYI